MGHLLDMHAGLTEAVVAAPGGPTTTTYAPFSGEPLVELPVSTPDDVDPGVRRRPRRAAGLGRPAAQGAGRGLPAAARPRARPPGRDPRPRPAGDRQGAQDAFEELVDVALTARHYGLGARRYLAPVAARGVCPGADAAHELRHPKGVVGIISPWNYPLTWRVSDALPALLAGNAVVHKPDAQTTLTALWVRAARRRGRPARRPLAGRPRRGPGGRAARSSTAPTTSASPARRRSGREVAERCADRLIGCSLELGGKNPMLVLADADLERAAEGAVRACFSNAGQLCVSMERHLRRRPGLRRVRRALRRADPEAMTLGSDLA